jgi:hypothetical protein
VALATVAAMTATAGPAAAAEPVWHRAACFSGGIDSIEVKEDEGRDFLTLAGRLDCFTPDKAAMFGYARYDYLDNRDGGLLRLADMRRYRSTSSTPFSEGRYVEGSAVAFAICVVTDVDVYVGCVQVIRTSFGSALDVIPMTWKDPVGQFMGDVRVVDPDDDYRPACGGCW